MRSTLLAVFVALAAVVASEWLVYELDRDDIRVAADDGSYDYALVVTPQNGGNIIGYNLRYTSAQCENSKAFVMQQSGVKAACVPMLKPKSQPDHDHEDH